MSEGLFVNEGKEAVVRSGSESFRCYAIKTHVVTAEDSLADVVETYAKPHLIEGDILFISEKMVACTEGRAILMASIKPGFLARFLCKFVTKSSVGIGLGIPQTMQCALDECGVFRILLASAVGVLGKILGRKGWFYHVAGYRARSIDGPCDYTIPPYNKYVVLGPLNPEGTAKELAAQLPGVVVLIVDVNDLGLNILGASAPFDEKKLFDLLRQNPLGQAGESTPMGILRPEPVSDRESDPEPNPEQ